MSFLIALLQTINRIFYEIQRKPKKYVKFTKNQQNYLDHIFQINQIPNYDIILESLLKFDTGVQIITKKRLQVYFKNQRYRHRKKVNLKHIYI
jgi:hypothetical protein